MANRDPFYRNARRILGLDLASAGRNALVILTNPPGRNLAIEATARAIQNISPFRAIVLLRGSHYWGLAFISGLAPIGRFLLDKNSRGPGTADAIELYRSLPRLASTIHRD